VCVQETSRAWPQISCGLIEILCPGLDAPGTEVVYACRAIAASRSFIGDACGGFDRAYDGIGTARSSVDREGPAIAARWTAIGTPSEWLENVSPAIPVAFRTPRTP
jgi:hypothetical protein